MMFRSRGRHRPGVMNRLESKYAAKLESDKNTGHVQWYAFEAIKLKLADKTYLTPDFLVMTNDGYLECHEVKGFMYDDAAVKLKVAANKFPFKFVLIKQLRGAWDFKEI